MLKCLMVYMVLTLETVALYLFLQKPFRKQHLNTIEYCKHVYALLNMCLLRQNNLLQNISPSLIFTEAWLYLKRL